MTKNKLLLLLVLLMTAATGAWAQTETLLTTITATGTEQASYSTANVATVSFSNSPNNSSHYTANWGWWGYGMTLTVTAAEGYTITKCVFYDNDGASATDSTDPFIVETEEQDKSPKVNGAAFGAFTSAGIKKIEVYGYATPATTGYSITLDEGTGNKDSQNWEITPQSSELGGGEAITVKYNGSREVKSVTVVKKAAVNPNAYMKWNRKQKQLVATEMPTTYKTVENANAGVTWEAGTYVVEGQVTISGMIELSGAVELIIKDGAKLTVNGQIDGGTNKLYIYGQAGMSGELVVNGTDADAFTSLSTLEVHSAKVTATSSKSGSGGFKNIEKFNVYGGLVDAKNTGSSGYGICLNQGGSINIYGGEVKAEGKGNSPAWGCGILCTYYGYKAPVTVFGGKLWVGSAAAYAFYEVTLTIDKSLGFNGEIESSSDNSTWNPTVGTPDTKYVRVGY